ncbi:DUF2848 domain-containing protein [Pikeienuella piscinae]|uniref:DUF2848 domain-containing protein n=1 Tax=Pikeienuella piscinae TaxID=2748098 RepID=A0A7L5C0X9_9RHOB|nr:DUF2848 domain-containing protein [Pikeienuella piscinae]QIE56768.1 DUF2848 domain-containing protein [Pikeienuella piscinae]
MSTTLLRLEPHDGAARDVTIDRAIVAGWTGRDQATVDHHVAELAELGIAPPSETPLYYRVAAAMATGATVIEVVGDGTSGEVEPVLIDDGDHLWLGLGSDHTDRELEAHSIALSKQICHKPIARAVWSYDEVRDHLDALELRAWIRSAPEEDWVLYQEGTLADIRPLPELITGSPAAKGAGRLEPGAAMMCGTVPALGGVRPARFFRMELRDPVLGRSIEHAYETLTLPIIA